MKPDRIQGRRPARRRWGWLAPVLVASAALAQGPTLEHMSLELRLDPPGGFQAKARLALAGLERDRLGVWLNSGLRVTAARDSSGQPLAFQHGWRSPLERYRREGRTVLFELGAPPAGGRAVLEIEYEGIGESGPEGADWRGILFVDRDQVRMSEQTIFYPQIPLSPDGPAIQRSPVEVWVDLPADLEVYVPAPLVGRSRSAAGRAAWHFVSQRPTVVSVMAGRYERRRLSEGGGELTLLLLPEHVELAEELGREARAAMADYGARFGALEEGVFGIVEIQCRSGTSINWASQGLAAFDRGAFGRGVPVGSVAHEVAHLWWGQKVTARGPGERFLTESLAEYSAWRYLRASGRGDLERRAVDAASARYADEAGRGHDTALGEVTFRTPGYSALAYAKGPLVLRFLETQLGLERLDRALAEYAAGAAFELGDFLACLADDGRLAPGLRAWFDADGHPRLELADVERDASGGLSGAVLAHGPDWAWEGGYPVDLELVVEGGTQRESLTLRGARTPFAFTPTAAAFVLRLDPDRIWPGAAADERILAGFRLVRSDPAQGALDVPCAGRRLVLEFDRDLAEVDLERLQQVQRASRTRAPWLLACAVDGKRLTLTTTPWEPGVAYSVALSGVLTDRRGAPVLTEALAFTTAASDDRSAPRVTRSVPSQAALHVPLDLAELQVTFSETMAAGRGFKKDVLRDFESKGLVFPPVHDLYWDAESRVLSCPLERLRPGTRYVLPVRGTIFRDLAGNPVEDFDLVFETGAE